MNLRTLTPVVTASLLLFAGCNSTDDRKEAGPHATQDTQVLAPDVCGSIQQLHTLDGIYLAGQPTAEDFRLAQERGLRTVINLRLPGELGNFDEEGVVTELGLNYVALPWNSADALTDDVFDRAERPMMMHCGSANRVGALWIPWRVLDQGVSFDEALTEAKTIGLRTPDYIERARLYIGTHGAR